MGRSILLQQVARPIYIHGMPNLSERVDTPIFKEFVYESSCPYFQALVNSVYMIGRSDVKGLFICLQKSRSYLNINEMLNWTSASSWTYILMDAQFPSQRPGLSQRNSPILLSVRPPPI